MKMMTSDGHFCDKAYHLQLFAAMIIVPRINSHIHSSFMWFFSYNLQRRNKQCYVQSMTIKFCWVYHSFSLKPLTEMVALDTWTSAPVHASSML